MLGSYSTQKKRLFYDIDVIDLMTSCDKSDPVQSNVREIDPFSNDSNERNMRVLISDIHLGMDLKYTECSKNLASLENFELK